jgi:hypothetical protein
VPKGSYQKNRFRKVLAKRKIKGNIKIQTLLRRIVYQERCSVIGAKEPLAL